MITPQDYSTWDWNVQEKLLIHSFECSKVRPIEKSKDGKLEFYEYCIIRKYTKAKFDITIYQTKSIMNYMNTDTKADQDSFSGRFKLVCTIHGWLYAKSLGVTNVSQT